MAKLYYDLITKKAVNPKTGKPYVLEDVPEELREAVKKLLDKDKKK